MQDRGQLLSLLEQSFGYSPVLLRNGGAIDKALARGGNADWGDTEQPIRNMVKDMGIVSEVRRLAWSLLGSAAMLCCV